MDEATQVLAEATLCVWNRLAGTLEGLTDDEIDWRPLPHANSINVIVRHLRIEAQWHLDCLRRGEPMPLAVTPELQRQIDAVPLDFHANLSALKALYTAFVETLHGVTRKELEERTAAAYGAGASPAEAHRLGYHQTVHVATHLGQIRMIRNLYSKSHGEAQRFFPDNPTYPRER